MGPTSRDVQILKVLQQEERSKEAQQTHVHCTTVNTANDFPQGLLCKKYQMLMRPRPELTLSCHSDMARIYKLLDLMGNADKRIPVWGIVLVQHVVSNIQADSLDVVETGGRLWYSLNEYTVSARPEHFPRLSWSEM